MINPRHSPTYRHHQLLGNVSIQSPQPHKNPSLLSQILANSSTETQEYYFLRQRMGRSKSVTNDQIKPIIEYAAYPILEDDDEQLRTQRDPKPHEEAREVNLRRLQETQSNVFNQPKIHFQNEKRELDLREQNLFKRRTQSLTLSNQLVQPLQRKLQDLGSASMESILKISDPNYSIARQYQKQTPQKLSVTKCFFDPDDNGMRGTRQDRSYMFGNQLGQYRRQSAHHLQTSINLQNLEQSLQVHQQYKNRMARKMEEKDFLKALKAQPSRQIKQTNIDRTRIYSFQDDNQFLGSNTPISTGPSNRNILSVQTPQKSTSKRPKFSSGVKGSIQPAKRSNVPVKGLFALALSNRSNQSYQKMYLQKVNQWQRI